MDIVTATSKVDRLLDILQTCPFRYASPVEQATFRFGYLDRRVRHKSGTGSPIPSANPYIIKENTHTAGVAEMEDAPGLGPGGLLPVGVRVPPPAPQ